MQDGTVVQGEDSTPRGTLWSKLSFSLYCCEHSRPRLKNILDPLTHLFQTYGEE